MTARDWSTPSRSSLITVGLIDKYKLARSVGKGQKTKRFVEGVGVAVASVSAYRDVLSAA